jgi:leucyl aminopeptidase
MNRNLVRLGLAAMLATGLTAAASPQAKRKAWITIGDAAFQQVRSLVPSMLPVETRQVPIAGAFDTVRVVSLDESSLVTLTAAIHQRTRQCGGFMYHPTEAQARAALVRQPGALPHPSYLIDNQALVGPVLERMQDRNIEETILGLSKFANRFHNSQAGVDASRWLLERWRALAEGRADISVKQVEHTGYRQPSVMLTIVGSEKPGEEIVLGAHLDSILVSRMSETAVAPGADDDASGVAAMTEVVRAIVEQGYRPKRTIHLIAYAAEEVGLRGSQQIAREFKQNGKLVLGVLQLDMTNYQGTANDIVLFTDYTDAQQNTFLAQLAGAYLPSLKVGYDKCGYACSDHASWDALGFPASMPFESSFAQDNPYIHTAKDTYANSGGQAVHALKFARLAAAFVIELGSD